MTFQAIFSNPTFRRLPLPLPFSSLYASASRYLQTDLSQKGVIHPAKWNRRRTQKVEQKTWSLAQPLVSLYIQCDNFMSNERLNTSPGTGDLFSQLHLPLTETNQQGAMRESQLGSHTVRSHGARLARIHMHDWLVLVLLGFIIVVLNVIHPFYRFVGKDMMSYLKYPFKPNTIPVWFVPIYAVLFPIGVFLIFYLRRRDVYDLHHAILGILYSVLITGVLTDAIKDAVGRPRPNFFWRCFPDGKDAYDQWGNVICHGNEHDIMEGHKSFPSGHTSWSFAGLAFLSLYLSGKIKVFDGKGHIAKLCVVVFPLLLAALVAISRVDDYWHHWQDVFTGGLLGLVMATVCYLQFFPPPYHIDGWRTYANVRVLEELRRNSNNLQNSVPEVEIQSNQRNNNSRLPVEDLESGLP